jgi:hypothetical protein
MPACPRERQNYLKDFSRAENTKNLMAPSCLGEAMRRGALIHRELY